MRFLGYDPANIKVVAYTTAALFASIAGALFARERTGEGHRHDERCNAQCDQAQPGVDDAGDNDDGGRGHPGANPEQPDYPEVAARHAHRPADDVQAGQGAQRCAARLVRDKTVDGRGLRFG